MLRYIYYIFYSAAPFFASNAAKKSILPPLTRGRHILDALTMVLTRDKKIRPDAFTEEFSRQKFAGILFSLMLSAVVQQDFDPTAVLEIIRRTIYEV